MNSMVQATPTFTDGLRISQVVQSKSAQGELMMLLLEREPEAKHLSRSLRDGLSPLHGGT